MTHWIWFGLIILTILWYVLVTVLVGVRGWKNIWDMIDELKKRAET